MPFERPFIFFWVWFSLFWHISLGVNKNEAYRSSIVWTGIFVAFLFFITILLSVTTLLNSKALEYHFFLIQKPLLIITNKVQGTRQAYIKKRKNITESNDHRMHYRMLIYKQKMFTTIE